MAVTCDSDTCFMRRCLLFIHFTLMYIVGGPSAHCYAAFCVVCIVFTYFAYVAVQGYTLYDFRDFWGGFVLGMSALLGTGAHIPGLDYL